MPRHELTSVPPVEERKALRAQLKRSWRSNADNWIAVIRSGGIASREVTNTVMMAEIMAEPPGNVLDLGCGEGVLLRDMAAQGLCVTGVDCCGKLVGVARKDLAGHKNVRVIHLDYERLSRRPEVLPAQFHTLVCNFSLLDDHVSLLLQRLRTLLIPMDDRAPRLIIQTQVAGRKSGWREETFDGLAVAGMAPWATMPMYLRNREDWINVLKASGYTHVKFHEVTDPYQPEQVLSTIIRAEALPHT